MMLRAGCRCRLGSIARAGGFCSRLAAAAAPILCTVDVVLLTLNPQPLHIDAHFCATETEWGKPLMNSLFTLGLMIGISVSDLTVGTTIANLGMTDVRFPKPVFHGDTLRSRTKVLAMRESKSRPDVGIVEFEHTCWNQRDEMVAICKRQALMRKKPA